MVAGGYVWPLKMWLVQIEIHCKSKIHPNLEDLTMKKKNVKYNDFYIDYTLKD